MHLALIATFLGASLGVSVGRIEITPPEPLPLGGYTERGDHVLEPGGEPLWARTVVFQAGSERIAVIAADMLTTPESLANAVQARLPKDVRLFLSATHTHCAPDSQMLNARLTFAVPGIASFKRRWLDWYAERIANGVLQTLAAARRDVPAVAVAERHVAANRARRAGGWPDTALIAVGASTGTPWLLHYAAHAVVFGQDRRQTSGDWPARLSAKYGEAALLQGAIGDVSPLADGPDGEARMADFLSHFASEALDKRHTVWRPGDRAGWVEQPIALDAVAAHPGFGKAYGVPDALAQIVVKQFAPPNASIRAFRLGKLAVVGVPGEPTSALGRRIRDAGRRIGFDPVLVVSHTNGWIGYVLEPADYDRGGYEATLSFNGRETGERIVEAGVAALQKLAKG